MPGRDDNRGFSNYEFAVNQQIQLQEAFKLFLELIERLKDEHALEFFASKDLKKWLGVRDTKKLEKKLAKFQTMDLALNKLSEDEKGLLNLIQVHKEVGLKLNRLLMKYNDIEDAKALKGAKVND